MAKDILAQAALDVAADSSPAGEAAPEVTEPTSGDSGGKKKERTIDEVRGELVRKIEEANATNREQLARIEGMLAARAPAQPSQPDGVPDVNTMSADQLEALRPSIPQTQMAAFDKMVNDRRIAESVRGVINQEFGKRDVAQVRKDTAQEAFTRYPDLHNETSQLRKMTNKVLDEWGSGVNSNPRVVLDAANEAASRLGISATRKAASGGPDIRSVGGRTAPAPSGANGGKTLSDEKADSIARALQGAMPRGKKFNREKIQEAHSLYTQHRDHVINQ